MMKLTLSPNRMKSLYSMLLMVSGTLNLFAGKEDTSSFYMILNLQVQQSSINQLSKDGSSRYYNYPKKFHTLLFDWRYDDLKMLSNDEIKSITNKFDTLYIKEQIAVFHHFKWKKKNLSNKQIKMIRKKTNIPILRCIPYLINTGKKKNKQTISNLVSVPLFTDRNRNVALVYTVKYYSGLDFSETDTLEIYMFINNQWKLVASKIVRMIMT